MWSNTLQLEENWESGIIHTNGVEKWVLSASEMLCNNLFEHWNIAVVYGAAMWDEWKGKVATVVEGLKDLARVAAPTWWWNAWHTVYFQNKKIALHELPWWATIEHANVYLWQWRVIHMQWLAKEIKELQSIWVHTLWRIHVAWWAHVIFSSLQKALDGAIEGIKGKHAVWTTKAWIGPAYALKALRTSVTINDIVSNNPHIKERIQNNLALFLCINNEGAEIECNKEFDMIRTILLWLVNSGDVVVDTYNTVLKNEAISGKKILVECSQSALLAIDWGFYPNVTSSDTTPNGIRSGLNIPMSNHTNVAVLKSIKSKVGNWPFPTKLHDCALAEKYRKATGEVGATTWRNRDIWWFDTVETRKVLSSHPSNIIVLTRLDDLHHMWKVQFATGYTNTVTGEKFASHTPLENDYDNTVVEYSREYDVSDTITWITDFNKLPTDYKNYVTDIMNVLQFQWNVYLWTGPYASDVIHYNPNQH